MHIIILNCGDFFGCCLQSYNTTRLCRQIEYYALAFNSYVYIHFGVHLYEVHVFVYRCLKAIIYALSHGLMEQPY